MSHNGPVLLVAECAIWQQSILSFSGHIEPVIEVNSQLFNFKFARHWKPLLAFGQHCGWYDTNEYWRIWLDSSVLPAFWAALWMIWHKQILKIPLFYPSSPGSLGPSMPASVSQSLSTSERTWVSQNHSQFQNTHSSSCGNPRRVTHEHMRSEVHFHNRKMTVLNVGSWSRHFT